MINQQIANVLYDIAKVKEKNGDNRFSVGAYRKAAHQIVNSPIPIDQLDYKNLKGIGEKIAKHIEEFLTTGKVQFIEDNISKLNSSQKIDELLRIEGIGEKKALKLYEELQITTIEELKKSIESGDILKVFKEKTVESIKKGIEYLDTTRGRIRLDEGINLAIQIYSYMRPYVNRIDACGSIRRSKITVGDIDIAVTAKNSPAEVFEKFQTMPIITKVIDSGDKKVSVWISGVRCDCYVFGEDHYEAGLQHLTGSADHNAKLRAVAKAKGYKLSQYGLVKVKEDESEERIDNGEEKDIYNKLGFEWIPPEFREGTTEFEIYRTGNLLPVLVNEKDIVADFHIHSNYSDGSNSIEDIVRYSIEKGLKKIAITDHSQSLKIANGLSIERLQQQWAEIDELRKKYPQITILKGSEVDIKSDDSLDYPDEVLKQFDVVIASIHTHTTQDVTEKYLNVIKSGKAHILGHLTGRMINERPGYKLNVEAILQACKQYNVAVEFNCQPMRLDVDDVIMKRCKQLGVKIAIGSDAHAKEQIVYAKTFGVWITKRAMLSKDDLL